MLCSTQVHVCTARRFMYNLAALSLFVISDREPELKFMKGSRRWQQHPTG